MINDPGEDSKEPKSYIHTSLLSIFSERFERLLMPQILSTVEHILPRNSIQFGFQIIH